MRARLQKCLHKIALNGRTTARIIANVAKRVANEGIVGEGRGDVGGKTKTKTRE